MAGLQTRAFPSLLFIPTIEVPTINIDCHPEQREGSASLFSFSPLIPSKAMDLLLLRFFGCPILVL
jgi:hypothetical protein